MLVRQASLGLYGSVPWVSALGSGLLILEFIVSSLTDCAIARLGFFRHPLNGVAHRAEMQPHPLPDLP